ncbi:hypothetical protein JCM8547_002015 [Rhodosporidiobolus lusitaniae]
MSLSNFTPVLPVGSLILVTGVNGFIGSHVANEALKLEYRVRGVVRDASKINSLKTRWDEQFPGQFEVATIPDLQAIGAFDEAMKGVSGVAHIAAVSGDMTTDLAAATETVKNIQFRAFEAAAKTSSVKRFVLTATLGTILADITGEPRTFTQDSWNEDSKELAKNEGPLQAMQTYYASKTEGEKAAWAWVKEKKPSFEFYTVLPSCSLGKILDASQHGSTAGMLTQFYNGVPIPIWTAAPAFNYVAVTDIALLHLGALLVPSSTVSPQRLFGAAGSMNGNDVLAIFRQLAPEKEFPQDFPGMVPDGGVYDRKGAEAILHAFGKEGWKSLEEAVKETVA